MPTAETGRPTAPSRRQPHDGCPVLPCAPLDFPCLPLYPPVAGYADIDPAVTDRAWKVGRSLWGLREFHRQLLDAAGIKG